MVYARVSQFYVKSMWCSLNVIWGGCASISSACLFWDLVNRLSLRFTEKKQSDKKQHLMDKRTMTIICQMGSFFNGKIAPKSVKFKIVVGKKKIFYNRSTKSAAFCAIQWMPLPNSFPSMQLKCQKLFLLQGSEPTMINGRDFSQSCNTYSVILLNVSLV